jgi:SAM-dependent methyltransferase
VNYPAIQRRLPHRLRRYILHFEAAIEDAVRRFAAELPDGARVLDAGAGEGAYKSYFGRQRYVGIDLAIGDQTWNYEGLDVLGDLTTLPFPSGSFDACVNIVTLEHVRLRRNPSRNPSPQRRPSLEPNPRRRQRRNPSPQQRPRASQKPRFRVRKRRPCAWTSENQSQTRHHGFDRRRQRCLTARFPRRPSSLNRRNR